MTTEKINTRKNEVLKQYQKKEFVKAILYILIQAIFAIITIAAVAVGMFKVWDYFNPTQDYLYFIAIYAMIGTALNLLISEITISRIKRHFTLKKFSMRIRQRQIKRYFDYLIKDSQDTF